MVQNARLFRKGIIYIKNFGFSAVMNESLEIVEPEKQI